MHRLLTSDNQSGLFEKLAIDQNSQEQIKLIFVNDKAKIIESTLDSGFLRSLKNLAAT